MLIQGHDDDQLRLSDIARIEKAYEDPTRNEMFYDHEYEFTSIEHLIQEIENYIYYYNNERIQVKLKGLTGM